MQILKKKSKTWFSRRKKNSHFQEKYQTFWTVNRISKIWSLFSILRIFQVISIFKNLRFFLILIRHFSNSPFSGLPNRGTKKMKQTKPTTWIILMEWSKLAKWAQMDLRWFRQICNRLEYSTQIFQEINHPLVPHKKERVTEFTKI